MAFLGFGRRKDPQAEIAKAGVALGAAIDQFDRDVAKAARRASKKQRRVRAPRGRMPWPDIRQPPKHRAGLPQPLRIHAPATVISRRRRLGGNVTAGPLALQGGARRAAAGIRSGLGAVRSRLRRLTGRLGGRR